MVDLNSKEQRVTHVSSISSVHEMKFKCLHYRYGTEYFQKILSPFCGPRTFGCSECIDRVLIYKSIFLSESICKQTRVVNALTRVFYRVHDKT